MTQQDAAKIVGGVVIGAAIAAAVIIWGKTSSGDTETDMTLSMLAGSQGAAAACEVGKAGHVRVRGGKHLTWKIENYCTTEQTVAVGNFQFGTAPGSGADCSAAGPNDPFDGGVRNVTLAAATTDQDGGIDPSKGEIKLKAHELPEGKNEIVYAFDVCLGTVKKDPILIIER